MSTAESGRSMAIERLPMVCTILASLLAVSGQVEAQHPLNLGFERAGVEGPGRPWGWRLLTFAPGAIQGLDSEITREGGRSFRISLAAADGDASAAGGAEPDAPVAHTFMFWIPPLSAWGREARLTGWIRAPDLRGRAVVTLQSWAWGAFAVDTAHATGPADENGWRPFAAGVAVDSTAYSLIVTVGSTGTGTAWFDGLAVEVGGRRLVDPPVARGPTDRESDRLSRHVHALAGVDAPPSIEAAGAAADDGDLEPFARIVGDARVVALGESTHGTSEFFRAKHRLTRFLVERLGFRVFLIEANQLAVERVNEYVKGGPGDAASAMRSMFRVWNTEEVRDLVEWMRARNARHPGDLVEFVGFDMQDPTLPIDSLRSLLVARDPALGRRVEELQADFREAWRAGPYPQAADERRAAWMGDAEEAWRLVSEARTRLLGAATGPADSVAIEWAVQNANVVRQAARSAFTQELATRDSAMASNILWTLERRFPGARAVVWAHDAHISKGADAAYNYYGGGSMGGVLSRALGEAYRAIGMLTYRGAYSGFLPGRELEVELFPAPVGSVENALHHIALARESGVLLADVRAATADDGGGWLLEPRPIRLLGYAAEDWGFAYPISVGRQFDAILFVDESAPSRLLPRAASGGAGR